ncbi:HVO_A0556 family zinc finger protein [Natronoarchaeum rubrum]|uniref:HVO_A0556 family zinc finger protein n=1 Tax=Natronoarchaeum rubrum TaxID=755311 RepID=UPI002111E185|nr:HVO_A0556 family zinc finger protein [Natronoarchaeum rubrum]HMB51354.1 HVO_A0556 family zinc finger protein [Natronoarchaeum rubrum]
MATVDRRTVLRDLEGDECPWTEECSGELQREEYKDTDALVCPDCDTPIVRVW